MLARSASSVSRPQEATLAGPLDDSGLSPPHTAAPAKPAGRAVLLTCDPFASKRKKLIFGLYVAFSIAAAADGWVIGEAVMHI